MKIYIFFNQIPFINFIITIITKDASARMVKVPYSWLYLLKMKTVLKYYIIISSFFLNLNKLDKFSLPAMSKISPLYYHIQMTLYPREELVAVKQFFPGRLGYSCQPKLNFKKNYFREKDRILLSDEKFLADTKFLHKRRIGYFFLKRW